jgi:hypothetical protein
MSNVSAVYQVFSDAENQRDWSAHISSACSNAGRIASSNKNLYTITGEWSLASTDCASAYQPLAPGLVQVSDCPYLQSGSMVVTLVLAMTARTRAPPTSARATARLAPRRASRATTRLSCASTTRRRRARTSTAPAGSSGRGGPSLPRTGRTRTALRVAGSRGTQRIVSTPTSAGEPIKTRS